MTPVIHVCAAVIKRDGAFLLALRPEGKHLAAHWEFPGGKVAAGESLEDCIRREIKEELGVVIDHSRHLYSLDHAYPGKTIKLHFMECALDESREPVALEHEAVIWVSPREAMELNLAPADRRFLYHWLG